MLVFATWPEMEGRTQLKYRQYLKSHIRIHATPGGFESLNSSRRVFLLGEDRDGKHATVEPAGAAYGFEHSVIQFDKADPKRSITHRDIYVRRNDRGVLQAVMRCDGEPAPEGRHPQCQLFEMFPELPNIEFVIGFDRSEMLDQVNEIERAVRDKFLGFKRAGENAFKTDPNARSLFLKYESELAALRRESLAEEQKNCRTERGFRTPKLKDGKCPPGSKDAMKFHEERRAQLSGERPPNSPPTASPSAR